MKPIDIKLRKTKNYEKKRTPLDVMCDSPSKRIVSSRLASVIDLDLTSWLTTKALSYGRWPYESSLLLRPSGRKR